jgi:cadmium resistance protein CadD (predicted permease)
MPREALYVGLACLIAAAALWFLTANLVVSGLLALLGVVLVLLGLQTSEYDDEEETDEEMDQEE